MKLTELELSLINKTDKSNVTKNDIKTLIRSNLEVLQYLDPIDDEKEILERSERVGYLEGLIK